MPGQQAGPALANYSLVQSNRTASGLLEKLSSNTTVSGVPVNSLYTNADLHNFDFDHELGQPGQFPFTRGIHESMYRDRLWTMRQFAGVGRAADTNQRFRYLLEQGQTGLSTAFDLPTQMGYDSDHPMAQGEVGRVGVAIDTVDDLAILFREIPLDTVSTSMTINAPAAIRLAMYAVLCEENGLPRNPLTATVQTAHRT